MKIKTNLYLMSVIFVIVIAVIGLVMFHALNQINRETKKSNSSSKLIKDIFELNIVTNEYTMYHEKRMREQWHIKYNSLYNELDIIRNMPLSPEHHFIIESIITDYNALGDLFMQLQHNLDRRKREIEENKSQVEITREARREKVLTNEIMMRSQRISTQAFKWSDMMQQRINQVGHRTNLIILFSIIGFAILSFFASFFNIRTIAWQIQKLIKGTDIIGKGNLEHRVETKTKNEIGQLAASFNQMVEDLKKSNISLQESEEKYGQVITTAKDAVMIFDAETRCFIEVNKACEEIYGYKREEFLNMKHTDITAEVEDSEDSIKEAIAGKLHKIPLRYHIKKDGTVFPVEISVSVFVHEGRNVLCGIIRDITERKKLERRLKAQHETTKVLATSDTIKEATIKVLQVICESLHWEFGVMWMYNLQENVLHCSELWHVPNIEVSEFKKKTREISFAPKIGLPGRVWASGKPAWIVDVVHDPNFPRASVADEEGLHGAFGFPITIDKEVLGILEFFSQEEKDPDKNLLNMMTTIGSQIGLFIKRKQAEDALLQSEKLKSIGIITAGISHEFNNILAIISGNVQLLEESRKDDEELTNALRIIRRMTDDGAEISRRMLEFTKTAKDTTGFVLIDIKDMIKQSIDFTMPKWKNMAQAKGIDYQIDKEGMKGIPEVLCNSTQMREVFTNILNNALDAMPDGGRVTFRTWSEEDTVFISISDTGVGMPEEVRKNIFDPFFTTRSPVGTGLGLSTAHGIITRHGGMVEVESEVGKGSTFTLQFPAAAKADSPEESPEQEQKQKIKVNSLRILVVDDEEEVCKMLDNFLSKRGHLVRTVDNGREAIILAQAADYDLVLCDMAMPNVYGYDVIKALNELANRPLIGMITGWGEELTPLDDEELKVDFIIKKPFDFSELTKNINDALDAG